LRSLRSQPASAAFDGTSTAFGFSAARVEFAAGRQWSGIKARRGMIFLRIDFLATN
jgi:hypothetical protein